MNWKYYNDRYIADKDLKIDSTNRSFRYGDGLFETIRISSGVPSFIELHLNRLVAGMKFLGIRVPENWLADFFREIIIQLCKKNNFTNARCRLTVWRSGGGFYKPDSNDPECLIELSALENSEYILNQEGLSLGIYSEIPKLINQLSAFKTSNAIVQVLAARYADEHHYGDVVILNQEGRIADTINSNLFFYRDRKLFTPASGEGGVDGVMRKVIISVCRTEGIEVNEMSTQVEELVGAEEIFLSNAINGIKWIKSFKNKKFGNKFASDLIYILNEEKDRHPLVSP